MLASQWVWQRTKSVRIPAEEQNAGRVVDYFYRMEFHITPRFFSDSNYLFFFETRKDVCLVRVLFALFTFFFFFFLICFVVFSFLNNFIFPIFFSFFFFCQIDAPDEATKFSWYFILLFCQLSVLSSRCNDFFFFFFFWFGLKPPHKNTAMRRFS